MGQSDGFVWVVEIGKPARIAQMQVRANLSMSQGAPLLSTWAELEMLEVAEQWRRKGLATWMMRTAINYLRKQGCQNIVFAVTHEDEIAAAGAFYKSLGWNLISRCYDGWELAVPLAE